MLKWIGLGCGVHDGEKITMCLSDWDAMELANEGFTNFCQYSCLLRDTVSQNIINLVNLGIFIKEDWTDYSYLMRDKYTVVEEYDS